MTTPEKKPKGLTALTKLPPELEQQLARAQGRRDKKIGDSALGITIALFGLAVFGFTGYLATRPDPSVWVLLGGAITGAVVLAFGALIADKETVWPVLRGMVGLAISIIRARKGEKEQ